MKYEIIILFKKILNLFYSIIIEVSKELQIERNNFNKISIIQIRKKDGVLIGN